MRLKGLNCIVTGGSSGIGAATVKRFVDEGAQVLIADIDICLLYTSDAADE